MKRIVKTSASLIAALSVAAGAFAAVPVQAASVDDETVTFIVEVEGDALLASDEAAELGADYIATAEAQEREQSLLQTQANVQSSIKKEAKVKGGIGYTYTAVFNGFSIEASKSKLDSIKAIDGVKNVYIASTKELKLESAVEMTSSLPAQTADDTLPTGYTGAGEVIAIIDSEFDVGHEFFSGTPENPKLSKSDIVNILEENTMNVSVAAKQVYRSSKNPFVYDYANNTADTYIFDDDLIHGTHVTGIAAGTGTSFTAVNESDEEETYTMTGVAPDAQLVLMKVSDINGNLYDDTMIAAMDDAAKIGVCAINFSIGSAYSSSAADPMYTEVLANLNNAGVALCAANGNEGIGYLSSSALAENPDYGTVNVPACYSTVTAVASVNNINKHSYRGSIKAADGTEMYYTDLNSSVSFDTAVTDSDIEYVYCESEMDDQLTGADAEGKIVLLEGIEDTGYLTKAYCANDLGAAGVVVYYYGTMPSNDSALYSMIDIPVISVASTDGEYLKNAETKTLTPNGKKDIVTSNTAAGEVSYFSSWGVDQTLELKPEISAPGGNVYSSYPGDKYAVMSGTSMATPHMTGVMALMNQYLDENNSGAIGAERVSLIENMLMSAADIIYQPENSDGEAVPYTPRVQGAGLVNTAAAMRTSAVFIGNSGKSKLSLGDKLNERVALEFTVKNLTDEEVAYNNISIDVLTDGYTTDENGSNTVTTDSTVRLTVLEDDAPESITVPANGETAVTINVTLDKDELERNSEIFTNGFFIDGFVTLASSDEDIVTISMPFTGFYGDWTSETVFDKTMYDEGGSEVYTNWIFKAGGISGTFLYSIADDSTYSLGGHMENGKYVYNADSIAISPNGDAMGDALGLKLTPLRAIRNLTLELSGGDFYESEEYTYVQPKYTQYGISFDGIDDLDETELPDGDYTLTVSTAFDYEGAKSESFELPVRVDRVKPQITGASIDGDTVSVSVSDNNYLYSVSLIYTDDNGEAYTGIADMPVALSKYPSAADGGAYTAEFDLSEFDLSDFGIYEADVEHIVIEVCDMARNSARAELTNALGTVIANMSDYTAASGITSAAFELTNTGADAVDGEAIIAFYDEDGVLIAADYQSISIDAGDTEEYKFQMFTDTQESAAVKLYIWDSVNGMRPLDEAKSF